MAIDVDVDIDVEVDVDVDVEVNIDVNVDIDVDVDIDIDLDVDIDMAAAHLFCTPAVYTVSRFMLPTCISSYCCTTKKLLYRVITTSDNDTVTVMFGSKSASEAQWETFATDRQEKINELQAITFDEEGASDAQNIAAPPKKFVFFGAKRPKKNA